MKQQHQKMLDELLDVEEGLSEWEMDFLDGLERIRDYALKIYQEQKLEQIWQKIFGDEKREAEPSNVR